MDECKNDLIQGLNNHRMKWCECNIEWRHVCVITIFIHSSINLQIKLKNNEMQLKLSLFQRDRADLEQVIGKTRIFWVNNKINKTVSHNMFIPGFTFIKKQKQSPKVFYKKMLLLKISQNVQKNTCARVSLLIKLQDEAWNIIKRDSGKGVFLWILQKF